MKKCFGYANRYIDEMNLADVGFLKICLCAMGILIGIAIPQDKKKSVAIGASTVFAVTYAPLMAKFLGVMLKKD